MKIEEQTYKIAWNALRLDPPETREQLKARGNMGGTDHMVVASIVDVPDGGVSVALFSMSGATGHPVPIGMLVEVWATLAYVLANETVGDPQLQGVFKEAFDKIREWVMETTGVNPRINHIQ